MSALIKGGGVRLELDLPPDCRSALDHRTPFVRCVDCEHDLGPALHAAFVCPLFGKPRRGIEVRCLSFVPRRREIDGADE